MAISPLAGKPAPKEMLVDPARIEQCYFGRRPSYFGTMKVHFGRAR